MLDTIQAAVMPVLASAIAAALILLIKYGINFIEAKVGELENKKHREAIIAALEEVDYIATKTVKAVKQTVVDDLREKSADGKLTSEEKEEVLNKAIDIFKNSITNETKNVLVKQINNLDSWIVDQLEAKVSEEKDNMFFKINGLANPK